ncbi:MAG: sugar ABC transporter permease [Symbiobacterium sp.]|uniref:carbohydrate ABC transporter permease n=1 Tax=Symbiobacterium sp. TaxID=1971213 RepID=UPI003464A5CD
MQSLRRRLAPYAYLSPALITILFLTIFPMVFTIYLAFTDANLYTFRTGPKLVGFQNFVEIFTGSFSKAFFPVLGWNIIYALFSVLTQFTFGLFLAILLNNPHMRESNLYRAILIIPWAIPGTLAVLAWRGLLNTSSGAINVALGTLFGIPPIPWLQDPLLARISVLLVNLWLGFPWFMTVCLGALQSIDTGLYEAAEIDGASPWQQFRNITFPLLTRMTVPLMISSFAHNFNNFGTAFLMTDGGPVRLSAFQAGYTDILVSVGYKLTVQQYRYGLSAALSLLLFIIVAVISLINMKMTGAFAEED